MFFTDTGSDNPYYNLAVEEILLKKSKDEYLILYIDKPSVIIGKHQIAPKEVNLEFIMKHDIPVIRRISGGGTVFHDEGNLNFTFIMNTEEGKQVDFPKYMAPVIDFLRSVGVDARFEGKNDIRTGGLKFSGNAEHIHRNRVLHHGTLLFSSSLDKLRNSLRKDISCYSSRGVDSVRSSVINLKDLTKAYNNIPEFRIGLKNYLMESFHATENYLLPDSVKSDASSLSASKYGTWEWNWAYGPEYNFHNRFLLSGEMITCSLFVKDGIIRECNLEGSETMRKTAGKLCGSRHFPGDMLRILLSEGIRVNEKEIFSFF